MQIHDFAGMTGEERASLERVLASHESLDDVFAWGRGQSPAVTPDDVVIQDEFSYDTLVPFTGQRWVVYATT
jgi:hypothetical protein